MSESLLYALEYSLRFTMQADSEMLEQLRSDMEGLMTELSDLSRRNDELMAAKDADHVVIREMDAQLKEYKRKYEQSKTELRGMKGVYPPVLHKQ